MQVLPLIFIVISSYHHIFDYRDDTTHLKIVLNEYLEGRVDMVAGLGEGDLSLQTVINYIDK